MSKLRGEIRILVVEDNETNQEVAAGMLRHLGYGAVDVAADGLQALATLAAQDFDLVLMDCHLPGMDGYETSQRIRRSDSAVRNHEIPIIATTAAVMEGDKRKCFAAGMNAYLSKPLRMAPLDQAIVEWTGCSERAGRAPVTAESPAKTKVPTR